MANSQNYNGETPDSIRKMLETSSLSKLVSEKMGVEAFIEAALMLLRSPKLMECTKESVMGGLLKAAMFGFRISEELGHCWLVPRWNKNIGANNAVFQIGYKGWQELVMRSGKVSDFDYGVVWEKDDFDFEQGTSAFLRHKKCRTPESRGKRVWVWAGAYMTANGRLSFHVCDIFEIERHRLMSDTQKDEGGRPTGMWYNHYDQMSIRIPMRYLCQLKLPKSVELMDAIDADESVQNFTTTGLVPIQQKELAEATPVTLHEDYLTLIETSATEQALREIWEKNKGVLDEPRKALFNDKITQRFNQLVAEGKISPVQKQA